MMLIMGNDNNWYCPSILAYDYDSPTKKDKDFIIVKFLKKKT
jgi:hypothetical protein